MPCRLNFGSLNSACRVLYYTGTTAEAAGSWTSKVAEKVADSSAGSPAAAQGAFSIKSAPPPTQHDGSSTSAISGAESPTSPGQASPGQSALARGLRLPWTPRGGRLLPGWGSGRSPRLTKEGALGHIDPEVLVTKQLPRIKVRYISAQNVEVSRGRRWIFACFQAPATKSPQQAAVLRS